jgi:hypothetical protein
MPSHVDTAVGLDITIREKAEAVEEGIDLSDQENGEEEEEGVRGLTQSLRSPAAAATHGGFLLRFLLRRPGTRSCPRWRWSRPCRRRSDLHLPRGSQQKPARFSVCWLPCV